MDEIPTALRDTSSNSKGNKKVFSGDRPLVQKYIIWFMGGILLVTIISFFINGITNNPSSEPVVVQETEIQPPQEEIEELEEVTIPENILGHIAYEEAPQSELRAISADGGIQLRQAAAERFNTMVRDARNQGIILNPISGFRSISDQEYLFFEVKEQRNQDARKRAEVSAPPGHSEHHTGYAVDIGDGNNPSTNLQESFENTAAYRWLEANASRYSFELSFPRDNLQGISYEPWHWRFVGDRHSLETFYRVRELTTPLNQR
ncbi:M15 family metallopeptidase [Cyanobacterium sp. IPPAS B-1200]|uniref:M15 family metallopeptidase n=1 Tax=Cyanobacterium sp. IPPAS B-1200 TaxID=1562720 RepID=UPI0008528420|nr:D-alanyl-D-alanine carboxypeptidase [Cyanobacterium sp. IPPAS B-1200]